MIRASRSGAARSAGSSPVYSKALWFWCSTRPSGLSAEIIWGRYYVERLASSRDALRGSFASYRAIDVSIAQNEQRKQHKLTLPVLAIGGGKGLGEGVANTMRLVADNVESKIIPDSGHWVAEETPEQLLAVLAPFLTPYRDAAAQ